MGLEVRPGKSSCDAPAQEQGINVLLPRKDPMVLEQSRGIKTSTWPGQYIDPAPDKNAHADHREGQCDPRPGTRDSKQ